MKLTNKYDSQNPSGLRGNKSLVGVTVTKILVLSISLGKYSAAIARS